jgi:hypothetical protein
MEKRKLDLHRSVTQIAKQEICNNRPVCRTECVGKEIEEISKKDRVLSTSVPKMDVMDLGIPRMSGTAENNRTNRAML